MILLRLIFVLFVSFVIHSQNLIHPSDNEAFLQNEVAEVRITISPIDLSTLLGDSLYSDHHFPASFTYTSNAFNDTIQQVGFRVRGNTSRDANKKSFKVSFNEFVTGQKFKGIEKMNLIGQHNDPSELRYYLSLKTLRENELICSRVSFVKLFINGEYKGLYLNVEHIDDEFLQKRFINDDQGNLYKCFWGADLNYWGANQNAYSNVYELKTNKTENDYSGLIDFLYNLNTLSAADFPCYIEEHFDVNAYLKTLASEIIIGHWDGYAFNKNNFYLYQRPSDGKFVFIEYDMDNTFGIDWFGIDWSNRSLNNWHETNRPLISRLLSYPYYKDQFNLYLSEILNQITTSSWLEDLQLKQNLVSDAVQSDSYYTMDYGFQFASFINAIDLPYGLHVTQGISQYLLNRINSGLNQIEIIGIQDPPCINSIDELSYDLNEEASYFNLLGQPVQLDKIRHQLIIQKLKNGKSIKLFIP